jgi:hypothetical protein
MTWVISLGVAVLGGVCGLLLTGFIANACVTWYQIPAREGASGYFVVFTALLGGVAGLVVSLITARIVATTLGESFGKEMGISLGVLLLIAGVATVICRLIAHVPPTIDGQELNLEVEFRFPANNNTTNPPTAEGKWYVQLDPNTSLNPDHASGYGEIKTAARLEDGRWIVPTVVPLFTERGMRSVTLFKEGSKDEIISFGLPVPGRPGKAFEEWSDWIPRQQSAGQPWPATRATCRFRVQVRPPPPPQAAYVDETAVKAEAAFVALPPDAPLSQWLPYTTYDQPQNERALQAIAKRPNLPREIEELALGDDQEMASAAIRCVTKLSIPLEPFNGPMQKVGQNIAERIRKVNAVPVEQDPSYLGAADISVRFSAWHSTISVLREKAGGDFIPELKTILELSRVRKDSHAMQMDVCRVASFYLREWAGVAPLPTDPPPR